MIILKTLIEGTDPKKIQALTVAWEKIKEYVNKEFTNVFTKNREFEWKHEVYYWIEFGITPNGKPYIIKGSHDWGIDNYLDYPTKDTDNFRGILLVEEVVKDWEKIKKIILNAKKEEENIYNFEP